MKIIDLPRGAGKTTILKWWAKTGAWTTGPVPTRVLLVPTTMHVRHIKSSDPDVRAITPDQLSTLRGATNVEIGIDELDEVLSQLIGYPVAVATRTGTT